MKKIKLRNVYKSFYKDNKNIAVLNNISVDFEKGKMYAIVGKSGVGKSTLLNIISAISSVDSGSVFVDDMDLNSLSNKEISKIRNEKIGFVFQDYNLLDFLNCYENVLMPLEISRENKYSEEEKENKISNLLDYVELNERKEHYPSELSGGEQQRIAIARALINDPSIILADEPTGSIDKENGEKILKLLKKISKDKCVIIVTHDENVLKFADVIYQLKDGNLQLKNKS